MGSTESKILAVCGNVQAPMREFRDVRDFTVDSSLLYL
jgi:hypothetical protein